MSAQAYSALGSIPVSEAPMDLTGTAFIFSLSFGVFMQCLLEAESGVQLPPPCDRFWIFFVGPGIIYTLDKIISLRTRYMELDIIETELLPSDVVKVKFYRYVPGSK